MSSMNSDLRWLAENEEWDGSFMFPYVFVEDGHVGYARRVGDSYHCFTKAQHQAACEELQDARDELLDVRRRESMAETSWSDWIKWRAVDDSSCPIPDGTLSQVRFSDGDESFLDGNPETWAWGLADELSITAYRYELPGPTSIMPEYTFSTPDEDEAWAEAEKKLNPVWQSPHPIGGVCVFHGCRYSENEPCPMCVLSGEAAKEEGKQPNYEPDDVAFVWADEGQKHDTEKPAMHLIPANIELEVARVMQFGAEKYGPDNWRSVPDLRNRYMSAAMRHVNAMRQGYTMDEESGLQHAAHAICCLMFIGETELEE